MKTLYASTARLRSCQAVKATTVIVGQAWINFYRGRFFVLPPVGIYSGSHHDNHCRLEILPTTNPPLYVYAVCSEHWFKPCRCAQNTLPTSGLPTFRMYIPTQYDCFLGQTYPPVVFSGQNRSNSPFSVSIHLSNFAMPSCFLGIVKLHRSMRT